MAAHIRHKNALPIGYLLQEYRIRGILGHGGFGITYLANDERLKMKVAIKEYLPQDIALREGQFNVVPKSEQDLECYQWGLDRFLDEARTLGRFNHANIVRMMRFIELHGTAYLIMEYQEGKTLKKYLHAHGPTLDEAMIGRIFLPILDGLRLVHQDGMLHRDIKPDNIYLRAGVNPMLIDFGSARYSLNERSRSLSVIVSAGFAPFEQYSSGGNQGPWSDVYGIGASIYSCITGGPPPEASERGASLLDGDPDPYIPAAEAAYGNYSENLLKCVDYSLAFRPKDRLQSAWKFHRVLRDVIGVAETESPSQSEPSGNKDAPSQNTTNQDDTRLIMPNRAKSGNQLDNDAADISPDEIDVRKQIQNDMRFQLEGALSSEEPPPKRFTKSGWFKGFMLLLSGLLLLGFGFIAAHFKLDDKVSELMKIGVFNVAAINAIQLKKMDQTAFEKAEKIGSIVAYEDYLDGCSYCEEERKALDEINKLKKKERQEGALTPFARAQKGGTRASYQYYLDHCLPDCRDASKARRMTQRLPEMVLVKGGQFKMGSPESERGRAPDENQHTVRVRDFLLSKNEVTFIEYVRFLNSAKKRGDPGRPWFQTKKEDGDSRIIGKVGKYSVEPGYENYPVTEVSWYGAQAYAEWLSQQSGHTYRLPTEAQWDYAMWAGSTTPFYTGDCIHTDQANYDGNYEYHDCEAKTGVFKKGPVAVAGYRANPWGINDLAGNVMEWTCSEYDKDYQGGEKRCADDPGQPVLRGGSWDNPPRWLRSANRYKYFSGYRNKTVGFRLVRRKG